MTLIADGLVTAGRSQLIESLDSINAAPGHNAVRRILAEALGELSGGRILDAGCGVGDDTRELAALTAPGGQVIGTVDSTELLDECWQRSAGSGLPADFRHANVCELDFDDGYFDAVRAKAALGRSHDPDRGAAELARVTKSGGRIAVFEYDLDAIVVDHPDVATTRRIIRECSDGYQHRWSGRQLSRRLLDLGVRQVSVTPHSDVLPAAVFASWMRSRFERTRQNGDTRVTTAEFEAWWEPLESAAARDRFFASVTGFAVCGTV